MTALTCVYAEENM